MKYRWLQLAAEGIAYDLQTARDVAAALRLSLKRSVGNGVVLVEGYPTRWAIHRAADNLCNT